MSYQAVSPRILKKIESIVDKKNILLTQEDMEPYSHDETPGLKFPPEVVVKVKNNAQLKELFNLCSKQKIPLTPRGGGTGLTGGAVPVKGGIVASFERMDAIKDIDKENYMAVVEPGVINGNLQTELAKQGLFYPVNPASMDSCTIGGNVAQSSSGANAVKYGGTKEYICGLKATLPSGDSINPGGKLVKNVTDYRLIQLLVGSEGTLAAISEIILKVIPLPEVKIDLVAGIKDLSVIKEIIYEIWNKKIIPTSVEYIDGKTVSITRDYVQETLSLPSTPHYLMIGIDGREGEVERDIQILGEILIQRDIQDTIVAQDSRDRDRLWKFRQSIRESLLHSGKGMVEEDIVVPRSRITEFMERSEKVYRRKGLTTGVYGHLGDGNLHFNFIRRSDNDDNWTRQVEEALRELFNIAISMGGKISGEHGVGLTKKKYLPMAISKTEFELIKNTKKMFDPHNILNPGKIFDV